MENAVFEINRANLLHNINYIKRRLQEGVKFCAMVKADGYGHNAVIVSKIIEESIDYFGVATVEEGVALRLNGITKPILCVGKNESVKASEYNIELAVESLLQLKNLISLKKQFKIHLKVDTGMHRLGFESKEEFQKALQLIRKNAQIKLVGVFTHFPTNDEKCYLQNHEKFEEYLQMVKCENIIVHCSNSLASKYNFLHHGMVRIGLSLYGYGEKNLKKVLKVKSKVLAIRNVKNGETVGYSQGFKAECNTLVATVFLGYYDGLNRKLGNKAFVKIRDKQYKIIGNICMDMFMVAVDENVKVGDDVIVFDDANYFASIIGTIPYEVLTSLKYSRAKIEVLG